MSTSPVSVACHLSISSRVSRIASCLRGEQRAARCSGPTVWMPRPLTTRRPRRSVSVNERVLRVREGRAEDHRCRGARGDAPVAELDRRPVRELGVGEHRLRREDALVQPLQQLAATVGVTRVGLGKVDVGVDEAGQQEAGTVVVDRRRDQVPGEGRTCFRRTRYDRHRRPRGHRRECPPARQPHSRRSAGPQRGTRARSERGSSDQLPRPQRYRPDCEKTSTDRRHPRGEGPQSGHIHVNNVRRSPPDGVWLLGLRAVLTELIPLALVVALVTAVDHSGGADAAHPATQTDGFGVPRRLAGRALRVDGDLRRGVGAPRRADDKPPSWASWLRIVRRRRAHRVRHLQVAHAQALRRTPRSG